ncbi:MAG: aspartyl protease [Microcoleus sp. PH2017_10_PVI_O_A]|uniref:aspartyl protease n=1 Tax=unclassified Microcoleus TaxID=2642155 RepID=UPI001DE8EE8D|nr:MULTISPECIES: aspartyl protease [unclassified Microcoleus]TAE77058.1 MAG: aspartyl protease [Oscillatoriales cyanobacterium]MCC3404577.1 aspartyl protease [Microcoleus sp. PH2017_10_PVI_O_A]MCC3463335.1 aspartyl protease [Microcoleus sp. PH2017_11_PCY_U_A]MCC3476895.1 aspartyl protease [Microcoleus sp. PH2017_12_PCY_D_A]MCC3527035.1 aspartyl protease [Microcoleus sp. PH2017_21_RUC_O_A]
MTLVLPNLQGKQMGQVITTITVTNRIDRVLAERGFIPAGEIRSFTLDKVLVDTGATLLALPARIISQLGLIQVGERDVETSAGIKKGRIFADAQIIVEGREGRFDCLELPEGVSAVLLGVIPMEELGLEPDLKNRRLRVLPMNSQQTYLMA